MKLALVLMVNDRDLPFLKLHVPVFRHSFDGLVCMADPADGGEAIGYMESLGATVGCAKWDYHWGDFATRAFRLAETLGYDAAMRLDPDECLMPDAGWHIRKLLEEQASLLVFPRHEFWGDRYHVRGDIWPDDQARCWKLNRGIQVVGKKHEGVLFASHGLSEDTTDPNCRVLRIRDPYLHLFHYGWSSKTAIWNAMIKYQSQAQVALGQSPVVSFAPDQPIASHPTVPFTTPQPIDPDTGPYAPFDE
jgi:hypothetical protein